MATDHNIRQLVINKMTDEQYDQAVKSADELYLTPDNSGSGTGTVTSVRVQATSPVVSSQSTEQTTTLNTTISLANNYGDTKNPYASKAANYVLAAPNGSAGTPSFRALVKADIPLASETAASGGTTTSLVTTGEKYTWNNKQDAISDLSTIRDGASAGVTAVQPGDLATVATTGSYNDLSNKPTIPVITDTYSATSSNGMSGKAVASAISNKADKATSLSGYGITDAYTKTEVDGLISSVYKPAGSVAFASLPTLSSNVLGNVYNVTDAFTTTANFVEGAGKSYPAGTNVVVVEPTSGTYKFDVLSGFVDLSGYVPTSRKINNKALTGDISLTASDVGALPDSTAIPQGTVKSVRVQAGTGLSSSTSTAQTETLNTTISIASGYKLPTTTEWGNKQDALTTQTAYTSKGSATKVPQITTNSLGQVTGITEVTITHPTEIPSQSGNSGKFLTTNGSTVSWATVNALPSQSGQSGKFLTTNGTNASWAAPVTWTYNAATKTMEVD